MGSTVPRRAMPLMVALLVVLLAVAVVAFSRSSSGGHKVAGGSPSTTPSFALSNDAILALSLQAAMRADDPNPTKIEYVRGPFSTLQPFMQDPTGPIAESSDPDYAKFPNAVLIEMSGTFTFKAAPGPDMPGASAPTGPVTFLMIDEAAQTWLAGGLLESWVDLSKVGVAIDLR